MPNSQRDSLERVRGFRRAAPAEACPAARRSLPDPETVEVVAAAAPAVAVWLVVRLLRLRIIPFPSAHPA